MTDYKAQAEEVLSQLSLKEKIALMSGSTPFWSGLNDMMGGGYSRHPWPAADAPRLGVPGIRFTGSAQETVKACPFIGFGLERFCPGALGCQRWSPGPQCFRAEGPCLRAAFQILQTTGN